MRCMFACPHFRLTTFQQPCKDMLHERGNATEKKVGEWALIALFLDKHDHGTNVSWWDSGRIKKKHHVNVMMSKAMTSCSMDMLQYRCACAMYMCEDMQMHSILKDHNHAYNFVHIFQIHIHNVVKCIYCWKKKERVFDASEFPSGCTATTARSSGPTLKSISKARHPVLWSQHNKCYDVFHIA